jgi:hypothetical protein
MAISSTTVGSAPSSDAEIHGGAASRGAGTDLSEGAIGAGEGALAGDDPAVGTGGVTDRVVLPVPVGGPLGGTGGGGGGEGFAGGATGVVGGLEGFNAIVASTLASGGGTTKRISTEPNRTRSWSRSGRGALRRSLLTKVPFELPMSSIVTSLPRRLIRACLRDTPLEGRAHWHSEARPTTMSTAGSWSSNRTLSAPLWTSK